VIGHSVPSQSPVCNQSHARGTVDPLAGSKQYRLHARALQLKKYGSIPHCRLRLLGGIQAVVECERNVLWACLQRQDRSEARCENCRVRGAYEHT
jgi:hypothetical protein